MTKVDGQRSIDTREEFDTLLVDIFQQATEFIQILTLKELYTKLRETKIDMKIWPGFIICAVTRHGVTV